MRRGRRLGVDAGAARVGLAASDPDGILASPVATLERRGLDGPALTAAIGAQAEAIDALEIVVGLPAHLSGALGAAAGEARALAEALAGAGWAVRLVDERLTTVEAHGALRRAGRKTKTHRSVVDQVAAVVILQHALDEERARGVPAGVTVSIQSPGPVANEETHA